MTILLNGFATWLDEAVAELRPPVEVFDGQAAALTVTDQFHRGRRIVGRFERSGLMGFKVAAGGRRLRVTVTLALDAVSVPGWHLPGSSDLVKAHQLPPRLVQVRAQGQLRQCVLLKGGKGITSARAVFDLLPDEVPDDGLICVEALDITEGHGLSREAREAVAGRVMGGGAAGLRVDGVVIEEAPEGKAVPRSERADGAGCEALSLVSGGGLAHLHRRGSRSLRSGFFVVNPVPPGVAGSGGRLTFRLGSMADTAGRATTARDRAPARRVLRRAGVEARRLRHRTREALGTAAPSVDQIVSVRDGALAGPVRATTAGNILELELPAPAAPLLVFLSARQGAVPALLSANWTG
ncbi:hypothetical protein [Nonomuraea sp. NPDC003754]